MSALKAIPPLQAPTSLGNATLAINIEHDVPIPEKLRLNRKYPFGQMQIGDSFFVPNVSVQTLNGAMANAQKKFGIKLTRRKVEGGVRCWRIE